MRCQKLFNSTRRDFIKQTALATAGLALSKYAFAKPPEDYTYAAIKNLSALISNKKASPVEITKACLKRIQLLNPILNAFITVTGEQALKEATLAEREIRNGKWKGPLHGIPIALKDNIDTAGVLTTAASALYKDRIPTQDAELVRRLKEAGAIIIGKTNLHEFALGTTSHISHYGPVRNPWNTAYIPGGSSGGSAVAVAAGMCYAAIGTDTGGSNRLPAACCGITGMKPTYGLISTQGIIPVIQSIDHAGVFSRSVEDSALVLNAVSSPLGGGYKLELSGSFSNRKAVVGVVKNYKASDEVIAVFETAVSVFRSMGFQMKPAEMPRIASSVNFGDSEIVAFHGQKMNEFKDAYDAVTIKDLSSLKIIGITDYINQRAQMEEDRITISRKLFKEMDVMILPTTTSATPTIADAKINGPFTLDPFNTDQFNYFGLPALTIPCGFDSNGLPLGLQIIGPRWGEAKVLEIASRYQQVAGWYLKHPIK